MADLSTSARRRAASLCADGYVQHYDERGHPINLESKQFGRELRRAKNDILSTMGVVVSGEDGNSGISNEQRKINLIAAENDYGLFVATLDQILVFIGSWWTSSLAGRVQVRRVPDLLKTTETKSVRFADVSLTSRRSEAIRRCHWRI